MDALANTEIKLAIVIPAVKPFFFKKTLESLAAQTNLNFTVYVGDDQGPANLLETIQQFNNKLNIRYHRFEENMGKKNLVAQWERCARLITSEEWFCLFSDDDLLSPDCVQSFYDTLRSTGGKYDVYRFDTAIIDENDHVRTICPRSPAIETAVNMAYFLLMGQRGNSMPDHIFKCRPFFEKGGFVNFPFAQASDWATSILHGKRKGIYTIHGPLVYWRKSGLNVSSNVRKSKSKSFIGHLAFITWLSDYFSDGELKENNITRLQFTGALKTNLNNVTRDHYYGYPLNSILTTAKAISKALSVSLISALVMMVKLNINIELKEIYIGIRRVLKLKDYSVN